MKKLLIALAICTASSTAMSRDISELSSPLMLLTPAVAQNQDAFNLNDLQREAVKNWMASMPSQRGVVEDKAVEVRAALRSAIIANESQEVLDSLAAEIGSLETQLVLMRANCVNHWRDVLNADQFEQALGLAGY
ncbi:hypothetical protein [Nitrincola schmidtii]|uniref:hypothetical protein n=1 Tax=Nitrincola schmidtii TaxID=1730894 RepID=UPI00124C0920|nr:hypothetical protein [Nitrincola schmidtii]